MLPLPDRLLLILGAASLVVGWSQSRRAVGLWFIAGAPALLVLATAAAPGDGQAATWIALSVSVGHVTYAVVLLTPPALGLAACILGPGVLAALWARHPTNVVPGALDVLGGWVSVASLALSSIALWWAWHGLLRQARRDDLHLGQLADRLRDEVAAQERSRIWRATVVKIHEQLLSTLRYLLQTEEIDRPGLQAYTRPGTGGPDAAGIALSQDVRQATAARIAAGIVRVDDSAVDLPVTEGVRSVIRPAIVECALNAVLHGGATRVGVAGRSSDDWCWFVISDNGSGVADDAVPGVGWNVTLGEALAQVGGSWTIARDAEQTVVTLQVPRMPQRDRGEFDEDGFQQGRVLITAPLMTVGFVGLIFTLLTGMNTGPAWPLLCIGSLATVAAAIVVAHRRRIGILTSTLITLGLAAIPFLIAATGLPPSGSAAATASITTVGYSIIAVGVWSRWWQWTVGLILWAVGVLALARVMSEESALPIVVALVNCLVIVPIVVAVVTIGSLRFRTAQVQLALEREAVTRESLRANAATLIDRHLSACVDQAEDIIRRVANGEDLTTALRHEIVCLEGLIRVTIQIDPVDSGEFARTAGRMVNIAFSRSIPMQVGTLTSSGDTRPIAPAVLDAMEQAVVKATHVTVRAFTDGSRDYLSLALTGVGELGLADTLRGLRGANAGIELSATPETDGTCIVTIARDRE